MLPELPLANVWFARSALDYVIMNELRQWASPGYLARRDLRRQRDFGQEPLVAPGDRVMGVVP